MEKFCDGRIAQDRFRGDQSVIPRGSINARCSPSKVELNPAAGNKCAYEQIQYPGYRRKGTDGFTQRSQRIVRGIIW